MPDNVRCRDCGYLAIRNYETRQLMEVESEIRFEGKFRERQVVVHTSTGGIVEQPMYIKRPICFRMEEQITKATLASYDENNPGRFMVVINDERHCDSFTEWKQGWTPKEHWEMWQSAELQALKDTVAIQARDTAAQEKAASDREAAFEKRQKDQQTTFENSMKWRTFHLGILGAAIATAGLAWAIYKETLPSKPIIVNFTTPTPVVNISLPKAEERDPSPSTKTENR